MYLLTQKMLQIWCHQKTIKKNKERADKLKEKEYKEDERQYKMLKKLIAKEAKSGNKSLYYNESYLFNDVISYRVIERLRAERDPNLISLCEEHDRLLEEGKI